MILSPELQRELLKARFDEVNYLPQDEIGQQLQGKKLIMFVGPSATGKTYVMREVKNLDPRFSLVPVFTTRGRREDDDPELFRTLPHTEESVMKLLERIRNRELVQYAVHPTQSHIYGTEIGDYRTEYNLLATFSGAVEQFRKLPFESTHTISLLPTAEVWATWFDSRYPEDHPNRRRRLEEAVISLNWLLEEEQGASILFIENINGDAATTARNAIEAIATKQTSDRAIDHAYDMRAWAKNALTKYSPGEQ